MANILAVDDDLGILRVIGKALKKDHHEITTISNPKEIYELNLVDYNLILLDIMMPDIDGFMLCNDIREKVDVPIIFLTALDDEGSLIKGLGLGGDDYLTKPFSISELRARINAHLRRESRENKNAVCFGEIQIRLRSKEVFVGNENLNLTFSEYEIVELLSLNKNQVFSREQIYEKIYGYDKEGFDSAITEHIKNIRRKFEKFNISPIKTEWGIGYRWIE